MIKEISEKTSREVDLAITGSNAEARPYQKRVIGKCVSFFENNTQTILVNSPTGSGKTVVGLLIAAIMQKKFGIGIGWSAMRSTLLDQAKVANIEMATGIKDLTMISMFCKKPPTHDASGRKIEMIVVDEAQHDASSSMSTIHNIIKPKYVLGLSATPYRTDKVKLCFQRVIEDAGIHQLIMQGFLSEYEHRTIEKWDVETVVDTYTRDRDVYGKSIFFWHKRQDAVDCLLSLRENGVTAESVFGDDGPSHRNKVLERFKSGETMCVVNMQLLTEGFDAPDLRTVFVRDSQKGPTIQMAGRVFRKHPDHPTKIVVQSVNTKWPMQRTAQPSTSSVWFPESNEWRGIGAGNNVETVGNASMIVMATMPMVTMPALLTQHAEAQNDDRTLLWRRQSH